MKKIWIKLALSGAGLGLFVILTMTFFLINSSSRIRDNSLTLIDQLLRDTFDRLIMSEVETVVSMMNSLENLVNEGQLTKDQADLIGQHIVREARYDKEGYFWGDEPDGTNRILYGSPSEGNNRIDLKDANGTLIVQNFLKMGTSGGGFTDYWFPKKGQDEPQPKRGYTLQSTFSGLVLGTGNYIDDIDLEVDSYHTQINDFIYQTLRKLIFSIILIYVFVCFSAAMIGVLMSRSIKEATLTLEDISNGEGDLTSQIPVRGKDEVSRLTLAFNSFVSKLSVMIRGIITSLKSAGSNSESLMSSSEETTASVMQISRNSNAIRELTGEFETQLNRVNGAFVSLGADIESLDSRIETQVSAIEESTASIVQMTASINSVASRAKEKRTSVSELLHRTEEGIEQISEAKQYVDDLTNSIQEIMAITSMINDIADRTNLLSMNASIEAAHAGDAGKGFGVVASEIRKLAESSSANARSIDLTLKKNVELIKKLENNTDLNVTIFKSVDKVAKETDHVFAEITRAMEELSIGAKEINMAVISLQDISTGVRDNSQSMNSQLGELNKSSKSMEQAAGKTIESVTEIQQGIEQIAIAMDHLNDSVRLIVNDVHEIESQVGVFKV